MNKPMIVVLASAFTTMALAQTPPVGTAPDTAATAITNETPSKPSTISVQEMLVSGPTQLKLHSLAMITQGNIKGEVDDSYLPGLTICAEDSALPLRSVAAQLLGQHFVEGKEVPNPEAVALLLKLASDESSYVRYNAVYYGLSRIPNKSDDIISLLIDVASKDKEPGLVDRIAESLEADHAKVVALLDKKLADGGNIAAFEVYEDLTGQQPPHADKYMDLPSSRPHLFIFNVSGKDAEAVKSALVKALKEAGVENPNVSISGSGENFALLAKTYITKDYLAVNKAFADHPEFKISQDMWLSPELEIQINSMQKQ